MKKGFTLRMFVWIISTPTNNNNNNKNNTKNNNTFSQNFQPNEESLYVYRKVALWNSTFSLKNIIGTNYWRKLLPMVTFTCHYII